MDGGGSLSYYPRMEIVLFNECKKKKKILQSDNVDLNSKTSYWVI